MRPQQGPGTSTTSAKRSGALALPWLLAVMGLLLLPAARAAEPAADEAAQRLRIATERRQVDVEFELRLRECQSRFAVTACVEAAQTTRRDKVHKLRRQEEALDGNERRRRAAERLEVIRQKTEAQARAVPPVRTGPAPSRPGGAASEGGGLLAPPLPQAAVPLPASPAGRGPGAGPTRTGAAGGSPARRGHAPAARCGTASPAGATQQGCCGQGPCLALAVAGSARAFRRVGPVARALNAPRARSIRQVGAAPGSAQWIDADQGQRQVVARATGALAGLADQHFSRLARRQGVSDRAQLDG